MSPTRAMITKYIIDLSKQQLTCDEIKNIIKLNIDDNTCLDFIQLHNLYNQISVSYDNNQDIINIFLNTMGSYIQHDISFNFNGYPEYFKEFYDISIKIVKKLTTINPFMIPTVLSQSIISYLTVKDIISSSLVNKTLSTDINADIVWKKLYQKRWSYLILPCSQNNICPSIDISWKKRYQLQDRIDKNWLDEKLDKYYKHNITYDGLSVTVTNVCFPQNIIITGLNNGVINIHNIDTNIHITNLLGHIGTILSLDYDKESKILVSGSSDNEIKMWNIETGVCLNTYNSFYDISNDIAYLPSKNMIIYSCSNKVYARDINSGSLIELINDTENKQITSFKLNENLIITGSYDSKIKMWSYDGKIIDILVGHTKKITHLKLVDNLIISSSVDNTIKIWSINDKKCINTVYYDSHVDCFDLSDNKLISATSDGTIHTWIINTDNILSQIKYENIQNSTSGGLRYTINTIYGIWFDTYRLIIRVRYNPTNKHIEMYDFASGEEYEKLLQ